MMWQTNTTIEVLLSPLFVGKKEVVPSFEALNLIPKSNYSSIAICPKLKTEPNLVFVQAINRNVREEIFDTKKENKFL